MGNLTGNLGSGFFQRAAGGLGPGNANGGAQPVAAAGGVGGGTIFRANPGCGVGSGPNDVGCCIGGPETALGCGGLGSACMEGAATAFTPTDWSCVGEGRGEYEQSIAHKVQAISHSRQFHTAGDIDTL